MPVVRLGWLAPTHQRVFACTLYILGISNKIVAHTATGQHSPLHDALSVHCKLYSMRHGKVSYPFLQKQNANKNDLIER